MSVDSPCVRICQIKSMGTCIGCYRSLDEIARWSQYSDDDKLQVLNKVQKRKLAAAEAPAQTVNHPVN